MLRFFSKLIIAAITAGAVEMVVGAYAMRGRISSSDLFVFTIVLIIVFTAVLSMLHMLETHARATVR